MAVLTFETADHGKIEVDTHTKRVYFFKDDYETELKTDNSFNDWWTRRWQLHHDQQRKTASLDVERPVQVAMINNC